MSINRLILGGPITKDGVETKTANSGTQIATFTITTFRRKKQSDERAVADHHRIVAFGKTAENIAKFFNAKDEITIMGELQYDNYDKQLADGSTFKVRTADIIVNEFFFMGGSKSNDGAQNHQQQANQPQGNNQGGGYNNQNQGNQPQGNQPNQNQNQQGSGWGSGSGWGN